MKYWILESDPETYSWDDMALDRRTQWDGVRDFQARNYIRSMLPGDKALFYHSGFRREIVGIVKVVSIPYPDPTCNDGAWSVVDVEALRPLERPVTLNVIRDEKSL